MNKILTLICSTSAIMLSGCYKIEKLEDGKYARINTITGDTVVVNKDGAAGLATPPPSSSAESAETKTLTTFVPQSGENLPIEFIYRYREQKLEYKISVETKGEPFIVAALNESGNEITIILRDAKDFEIVEIPFTKFTAPVNEKGAVVRLNLQGSRGISLSDFKIISEVGARFTYTPGFKSEMAAWVFRANAGKPQPTPTVPLK
jgi:hypothetical protein